MNVLRRCWRRFDSSTYRSALTCRPSLICSLVVLLACSLLILPNRLSAQQIWYASYTNALDAIKKQQWADAERLLRDAKRTGPAAGRRVLFYGSRREDYLPDYYLAMALLRQGKGEEARQLLDSVVRSNLIRANDREYADLQNYVRETTTLLAGGRGAKPDLTPEGGGAGRAGGGVVATTTIPVDPLAARRATFEERLRAARDQIRENRFSDAHSALDAAAGLGIDQSRVDTVAGELRRAEAADVEGSFRRALQAERVGEAEQEMTRWARIDPSSPGLAGARSSLDKLKDRLGALLVERQGVQAFLQGQYEAALQTLTGLVKRGGASPRAQFFLACSQAALGLLQGGATSQLAGARATYRAARQQQGQFTRERRFVSPRILQVLEGT